MRVDFTPRRSGVMAPDPKLVERVHASRTRALVRVVEQSDGRASKPHSKPRSRRSISSSSTA